jgi:hypothetical protein
MTKAVPKLKNCSQLPVCDNWFVNKLLRTPQKISIGYGSIIKCKTADMASAVPGKQVA